MSRRRASIPLAIAGALLLPGAAMAQPVDFEGVAEYKSFYGNGCPPLMTGDIEFRQLEAGGAPRRIVQRFGDFAIRSELIDAPPGTGTGGPAVWVDIEEDGYERFLRIDELTSASDATTLRGQFFELRAAAGRAGERRMEELIARLLGDPSKVRRADLRPVARPRDACAFDFELTPLDQDAQFPVQEDLWRTDPGPPTLAEPGIPDTGILEDWGSGWTSTKDGKGWVLHQLATPVSIESLDPSRRAPELADIPATARFLELDGDGDRRVLTVALRALAELPDRLESQAPIPLMLFRGADGSWSFPKQATTLPPRDAFPRDGVAQDPGVDRDGELLQSVLDELAGSALGDEPSAPVDGDAGPAEWPPFPGSADGARVAVAGVTPSSGQAYLFAGPWSIDLDTAVTAATGEPAAIEGTLGVVEGFGGAIDDVELRLPETAREKAGWASDPGLSVQPRPDGFTATVTCREPGEATLVVSVALKGVGSGFGLLDELGLPAGGASTHVYLPLVMKCS